MIQWWQSLTTAQEIFAYVAIPATLILILQTLLLLLGLGDHDGDTDLSGHDHDVFAGHDSPADMDHADLPHDGIFGHDHPDDVFHGDSGLRLFTFRGIIAFFAVMGWTGLSLLGKGVYTSLSVTLALLAGLAAMVLVALAMRWFYRAQNSGNIDIRNAIGASGTVYITIPPARQEQGKVNLVLQGQYTELSAVTDNETPLTTGTEVTVVGISGLNTLVVKRK